MSSEEQPQQAQAMAQATVQPTQRQKGPTIILKLESADHDPRRSYCFTEANKYLNRYRGLVVQQSGMSDSWFSLYEMRKVRPAEPNFKFVGTTTSWGDLEGTVIMLEKMWKACGYDFRRRSNFDDAVGLDLARTAKDVGLMISLLIAENDWETSIAAYQNGNETFGKAKYLVVADPMHTPQTKSAPKEMRQMLDDAVDGEEENVWKVKKKLTFDTDSEDEKPTRTRKPANPVFDLLMNSMKAGHMTIDELARVASALAAKDDAEVVNPKRYTRVAEQAPQRPRWASSRDEADWEYEVARDDMTTWGNSGRLVTVLQNLTIRSFDGAKSNPEEARAWLSKFLHFANLSGWNASQRLEMFTDSLTNPAKYWIRQLPAETKTNWNSLQQAFKRKYCTDVVPPRLQYYKLTQKTDELASNYLYRLNGAALRAGIDFRDPDYPEHLEDHIQQYFDTLHDKNLQMQVHCIRLRR